MTDRAKQLLEDSAQCCWPGTGDYAGLSADNLNAFVRSIVADCTETVREVLRDSDFNLGYIEANELQLRMRRNFGLNE